MVTFGRLPSASYKSSTYGPWMGVGSDYQSRPSMQTLVVELFA